MSSLLLATLPCELFHAFSSARSSRAVSQHAPLRAARGDRSRAWLLWISRSRRHPALARSCWGPECGRDRCSRVRLPLVPRIHDVILPWQTHCQGERSCFACSASDEAFWTSSSFLDVLCHRRHHHEHLVKSLRSQACGELPRNGVRLIFHSAGQLWNTFVTFAKRSR